MTHSVDTTTTEWLNRSMNLNWTTSPCSIAYIEVSLPTGPVYVLDTRFHLYEISS